MPVYTLLFNNFLNVIFSFSGFQEYLQTAPTYDFPSYRQLVHNVTQAFNSISNNVISIETKLRDSGQTSISDLIRKIQFKEKEKLEMVSYLGKDPQYFIQHPLDPSIQAHN